MKWIKYQIVQSMNGETPVLVNKKIDYSNENLAIAEAEAYDGYTIEEDSESYNREPLNIEFGGTSASTAEQARQNIGAVSKEYTDRFRCFGSLTDIGITSFPTTMSAVAEAMPANSMIVIDTRTIMSGGSEEISDWGNTSNGTAYISKGYSIARVTMSIVYGSGSAVKGRLFVGSWANAENKVGWCDYGFDGNESYPGCFYRNVDGVIEWINPPMVIGTEYKTTERYKNKPVYTKAVSCGNFPSSGSSKSIAHGADATQIVRCSGCIDNRDTLPFYDPEKGEIRIDSSKINIKICVVSWKSSADITTLTATAQIWYTKD